MTVVVIGLVLRCLWAQAKIREKNARIDELLRRHEPRGHTKVAGRSCGIEVQTHRAVEIENCVVR